jgi:hypothetical protein
VAFERGRSRWIELFADMPPSRQRLAIQAARR